MISPFQLDGRKALVTLFGRPFPLHAGASGRVILAFLPADSREALLSEPLERLSPRTVVDPAGLREMLESVRVTGVAISRSERHEGAAAVAAPVFDAHGVAGAMSVCGPEFRFDEASLDRYAPLLKTAALQLSRELGWR